MLAILDSQNRITMVSMDETETETTLEGKVTVANLLMMHAQVAKPRMMVSYDV